MKHAILTGILLGALGHPAFAQPKTNDKAHADDLAKAADAAADLANVQSPDLAKAADATADVANTPAPAPAANPDAAKAAADVDLSALGLDPASTATSFDDKLNIYGFADINYQLQHWDKAYPYIPQDGRGFGVGNLNLYVAKNLMPRARALAEIRFTFLPNGGSNADGTTTTAYANDVVNANRPTQYGGIVIERVYAEYDLTSWLTVRGGRWLTPYGIWNVDHGSPAIIGTSRPYIIGEQFFPEHQTGLDLFGSKLAGAYKIGYHVTATNGRGDLEALEDPDKKLAFGGRLELETPWGLKLGASYYRGRYTGVAPAFGVAAPTWKEQAYGADAQYDHGGFHAQGEVIARTRDWNGQRPAGYDTDTDFGAYGLVGYRLDKAWNVMPFFLYENYRPSNSAAIPDLEAQTLGFNFRPSGSLVLKVQGAVVEFHDNGGSIIKGATLYLASTQASFVF